MTDKTPLTIVNPGRNRFWHGVHAPNNVKFPLLIELREKTNSGSEILMSFSKVIAKAPTIADPKAIEEAMREILVRAERVDEFVGIIAKGA